MRLTGECMRCIFEHHWALVERCADEEKQAEFMRQVCRVLWESDPAVAAPVPTAALQRIYARMFPQEDRYAALKESYNALLLQKLPALLLRVRAAADPLKLAIWMAMAGNYIDFGVLKEIDDAHLMEMILTPDEEALSAAELQNLRSDLSKAKALTYCLDNCGEIVLDRIVMEVLREEYPDLKITALVRGEPVLNDATEEDARAVGIDRFAAIVGNGSNVGGTHLPMLGAQARKAVQAADILISKGQGNFETLVGTGLNIYYLFLAKCRFYMRWFGMGHMRGQLINERRFSVDNAPL